jgi:hypothetical protein
MKEEITPLYEEVKHHENLRHEAKAERLRQEILDRLDLNALLALLPESLRKNHTSLPAAERKETILWHVLLLPSQVEVLDETVNGDQATLKVRGYHDRSYMGGPGWRRGDVLLARVEGEWKVDMEEWNAEKIPGSRTSDTPSSTQPGPGKVDQGSPVDPSAYMEIAAFPPMGKETKVRFSPDGQYLATFNARPYEDGYLALIDLASTNVIWSSNVAEPRTICFLPAGSAFAMLDGSFDVRIVPLEPNLAMDRGLTSAKLDYEAAVESSAGDERHALACSPDGTHLAVASGRGDDARIAMWNAQGSEYEYSLEQTIPTTRTQRNLTFSPDGQWIVGYSESSQNVPENGEITFWREAAG